MTFSLVPCTNCHKNFLKDNRHINENKKLGNNFYCSPLCQYSYKSKKIEYECDNSDCRNKFKRTPKNKSLFYYCSRSCAASINNKKFPKKIAEVRKCFYCNNVFVKGKKYCSVQCKSNALTISKKEIIDRICQFYKKCGRIPVKRELWGIYKPARKYFGTWNNAIVAAGFIPNPVLFAKRHIANDGHICDSLAEQLIDDYLYENSITHERNTPYPEGLYTFDFRVGNSLIEYFGLVGEHKRYDQLRIIKQKIARKHKLNLLEIYPKDLYPKNRLNEIINS